MIDELKKESPSNTTTMVGCIRGNARRELIVPTMTLYLPPHHNVVDAAFEARFPNYVFHKTSSVTELAQALPAADALLTSNPWYLPDVAKAVREHFGFVVDDPVRNDASDRLNRTA